MLSRFLWLFLPQLSYAFFLWALLIVTLRVLGAESAGDLALAFAITAPLFLFGGLQLKSILVVDAERKRPPRMYGRLYSYGAIAASCVALGIGILLYPDRAILIFFVALFRFAEGGSELFHSFFLRAGDTPAMGKSLFLRAALGMMIFCTLIYLFESLTEAAFSLVCVSILIALFFDQKEYKRILLTEPPREESEAVEKLSPLFWLALPLGMTVLFSSATTNIPRYLLEYEFGAKELGVFAALFALANALSRVPTAAATLLRPRLAEDLLHQKELYLKRSLKLFLFTLLFWGAVIGMTAFWGEGILVFFYGGELQSFGSPFLLIIIAHLFLSVSGIGNTMLQAQQIFHLQPTLYGVNLVISIVLSYLLIPGGGIDGAAWAVIGYGISSLLLYFLVFLWLSRSRESSL